MTSRSRDVILVTVFVSIFILYGIAMCFNFITGKPIPEDLTIFVRVAMGAAGIALSRFLLSSEKDNDKDD